MIRRPTTIIKVVLVVLAVGTAIGTGVAGAVADDQAESTGLLLQQEANNTTVHHDNPATVAEGGNLSATENWLESELAKSFSESSVKVSQGQYEEARDLVDNDTRELMGQYVEVAGETADEGDDQRAEELRETEETQREFVNQTQEYDETYREYQEARRNGNETRARELARELERLSDNATRSGTDLNRELRNVSRTTGADLGNATTAINRTLQNISSRQKEIRESTFTETSLSVTTTADSFSFRDPLPLSGRLVDENGTALANRTVRIQVGSLDHTVATGPNGTFDLQYRPVLLSLEADRVPVFYRPAETSRYLGSNASVSATVEQSTPGVTVGVNRTAVRFDDTMTVSGQVEIEGTGVEDLPLEITIEGQHLGMTRTNADGRFTFNGSVPARIPTGEAQVIARIAVEDRAVEQTLGTTALQIQSTETNLTVNATGVDGRIAVDGRLTTADGQPLTNRSVRIEVAGKTMTAVETDSHGRYATTVRMPESVSNSDISAVNVTADVSGSGTNLEPARATTTVRLSEERGFAVPSLSDLRRIIAKHPVAVGLLAVSVIAIGLLAGWVVRRRRDWQPGDTATDDRPDPGTPGTDQSREVISSLLARASDRVVDDPETAIRAGYAAVRKRFGADAAATHWEFYRQSREEAEQPDALRDLVETYEHAVFGHGVGDEAATEAVETAAALAGEEKATDGGTVDAE